MIFKNNVLLRNRLNNLEKLFIEIRLCLEDNGKEFNSFTTECVYIRKMLFEYYKRIYTANQICSSKGIKRLL